jgi:hypothetical protein
MEARTAGVGEIAFLTGVLCAALGGCFYPPHASTPPPSQVRLAVPYDLAWDSVNAVINQNKYKVQATNPEQGIIEAQGISFTGQEADCGEFRNLGGVSAVDPTAASSAEYNFHLKADGPEASIVKVEATFVAPLSIPFHPPSDVQCVSRGTDEARLLSEIQTQAGLAHRPQYVK